MYEHYLLMRHKELLAEAESIRLITEARRGRGNRIDFFPRMLAWIGSLLCNLGSQLEKRFGEEVTINQSQSMDSSLEV